MAGLTETLLLEAQAKLTPEALRRFEQRRDKPNVLRLLSEAANRWIPNLADIKKASEQTQAFSLLQKQTVVLTDAKDIVLGGTAPISKMESQTFVYKQVEFNISEKLVMQNHWDFNTILNNMFEQYEAGLIDGIEQLVIDGLIAKRSHVNVISDGDFGSQSTWVPSTDYYATIPKSLEEQFYGIVEGDMSLNNYGGSFLIDIFSTTWANQWKNFMMQGNSNNTNLAWQEDLGFAGVKSNKLKPLTAVSRHLIIPDGGASLVWWNENDKLSNRARGVIADGWELYTMPSKLIPGLMLEIASKSSMVDNSGLTAQRGSNQDIQYNFKIGAYFLLAAQPFSTSGETAIFEYRTLKS